MYDLPSGVTSANSFVLFFRYWPNNFPTTKTNYCLTYTYGYCLFPGTYILNNVNNLQGATAQVLLMVKR